MNNYQQNLVAEMRRAKGLMMSAIVSGDQDRIAKTRADYTEANVRLQLSKVDDEIRKISRDALNEELVNLVKTHHDRDSVGGDELGDKTRAMMLRIAHDLLDYVGDHPEYQDQEPEDEVDWDLIESITS